jgi:MerR family transcriptional regulator, mercuric resistance operon regulatory protein
LLEAGRQRHSRPDAGLQARAQAKLAEVEAKITDLQVIAGMLRAGRAGWLRRPGHRRGRS